MPYLHRFDVSKANVRWVTVSSFPSTKTKSVNSNLISTEHYSQTNVDDYNLMNIANVLTKTVDFFSTLESALD